MVKQQGPPRDRPKPRPRPTGPTPEDFARVLERLELKLEHMSKGMRIALRAFERFSRVMRELPAEDKMFDEDPMEIDDVACENKADDGEPCGDVGRYYPDYQMYLCDDCADGYDTSAR